MVYLGFILWAYLGHAQFTTDFDCRQQPYQS